MFYSTYTKINDKWRGYYPKGGGEVRLRIKPVGNLNTITLLDPGVPRGITGWSYVAGAVHINVCITLIESTRKGQVKFELVILQIF